MRLSCILLFAGVAAFAQTPETPLQSLPYSPSLDLTDMDRSVNPCEDFYRYSCGGWLKKNPIPSDQSSWSVYSKLTQDNERFLWGILEDTAKPNAARAPVEREIGDFFAACMDESSVEKAGAGPLREGLVAISALKSAADFPEVLAREHAAQNFGMLFSFSSSQDYADSSREIAFAGAGGLGLPDRDYYTKTDAKSEEIRQKYVAHVAQMLELAGDHQLRVRVREAGELGRAGRRRSQTRVELVDDRGGAGISGADRALKRLRAVSELLEVGVAGKTAGWHRASFHQGPKSAIYALSLTAGLRRLIYG